MWKKAMKTSGIGNCRTDLDRNRIVVCRRRFGYLVGELVGVNALEFLNVEERTGELHLGRNRILVCRS